MSILGPLLFLVYISDLPTAVNHCSVSLYADDTVLYCYSGSYVKDLENALNEDLSRIALWLNRNKLTVNIEKTKSILIGAIANCVLPLLYLSQNLIKKFRALHSLITWG